MEPYFPIPIALEDVVDGLPQERAPEAVVPPVQLDQQNDLLQVEDLLLDNVEQNIAPPITTLLPDPVALPVLPNPHPNEYADVAENIYQEVVKLIPDINRRWILDRSGYEMHHLVNYIFDNLENIPVEPVYTRNEDLNSSRTEADDIEFNMKGDEATDAVVEVLETFIRQLKDERAVSCRKLSPFLKQKYSNVKCAVLNALPRMDPRKLFAICRLLNMRRLSRSLANEFQVAQLWKQNPPWLASKRDPKNQPDNNLDAEWQSAYNMVKKAITNGKETIVRYTCCVCYDDFSAKKIISCGVLAVEEAATDSHYVCHGCMRGQANALCSDGKLAEGGSGICCLDPCCDKTIPWARVKVLLAKDVRHRLGKRLDNEALLNIDGLESCKRCSFAMLIETPVEIDKVFSCEKCNSEFCRMCKHDWKPHIGKPCSEMKAVENEQEVKRKRLEEDLSMAIMRICHKCKTQFAKEDGCNKMTCLCGATQCYICRAQNIGYEHFCQHLRDPKTPGCPNNCTSCLLWEKTDVVNKKALDSVRQQALTDRSLHDFASRL